MAPIDAQSSVCEIPPHGTVTYHEDTSEKGQPAPGQSVIPVSNYNTTMSVFAILTPVIA
jgi:hypothetical protein